MLLRLATLGILGALAAPAQLPPFPGPIPNPNGAELPPVINLPQPGPGGYPPGRPPLDSIPLPRSERRGSPPNLSRSTDSATGILRERTDRQITIESDDHRVIWYRISDDIQVDKEAMPAKLEDFAFGDRILVEHVEDDLGNFGAVTVHWVSAASEESRAAAARGWDLPNGNEIEEEVQRPRLRRGKPEEKPEPEAAQTPPRELIPPGEPPPPAPPDAVIDRSRAVSAEFSSTLPRFAVRQLTTRYLKQYAREDWRALDLVTANLRYRDGIEEYFDITVGGKKTDAAMEDIEGARSTGEFYTLVNEIMDPLTATVFTRSGQDVIRGRRAWKYRFEVARERSHWRIVTPSQLYFPAYRGSLWIDAETFRVLRLEQEAVGIPAKFPFETAEMSVDYDLVRLEKPFVLPIEAEILHCIRAVSACFKNHSEYRNYVKYDAESDIVFPDAN